MTFGKTLEKIRRSKGKKQREVAEKIGMDYSYFSRLANDRFESRPTRETIDKIADALECTPEERAELLTAAGRIDRDIEKAAAQLAARKPDIGKLFRAVVRLSPERIDEIMQQVESEVEAAEQSKSRKKKKKRSNA